MAENNIMEKVEEIVKKVEKDPSLLAELKAEPVKTIEKITGIDLPDDQANAVLEAIKAKVSVSEIEEAAEKIGLGNLGDIAGKLGGMFGEKK